MRRFAQCWCLFGGLILVQLSTSMAFGQGIFIASQGPVNRSMGSAGTAAPLEAIGSLYWNPASISALPSSEIGFGTALVLPTIETDSSITGLAAGSTRAEPGVSAVPTLGWVHQIEGSPFTVGLGMFGAAGFRTNFPASTTNPYFLPQSNTPGVPGGLGRIYTQAAFLEIVPTVSYQVTDRLSVGAGPTLTLADVIIDPLVVTALDDADGSGAPRYPSGRGTRTHWGGGVQLGVYYETEDGLHMGATWKSPQWMETFRFQTENEIGLPAVGRFDLDLPMIVSLGAAYSGWDNLVVSADFRYLDYANTDGFDRAGFNPDGSITGVGWDSVFSLATGVQYEANENLYLRAGYTFNENPIPESLTSLNVLAPLHFQHQFHAGTSYRMFKQVWLNLAYSFYPESEISGPILTPLGAIPGSRVTSRLSVHILDVGLTVRY